MKPWRTVATSPEAAGAQLVLQERDGVFVIRSGGQVLMSSAQHGSEEAMAEAGLRGLSSGRPEVLLGGLGLGYTLRAALDRLPSQAQVLVLEFSEAVVAWNRGPLAALAQAPLEDPRVSVERAELGRFVSTTDRRFDCILLDVDNGPSALSRPGNQWLYEAAGLSAFRQVLRPGGVLVIWSAGPDPRFLEKLHKAGFSAKEERVTARKGSGAKHMLYLAQVPVQRR